MPAATDAKTIVDRRRKRPRSVHFSLEPGSWRRVTHAVEQRSRIDRIDVGGQGGHKFFARVSVPALRDFDARDQGVSVLARFTDVARVQRDAALQIVDRSRVLL